jgi:hypothetical protein
MAPLLGRNKEETSKRDKPWGNRLYSGGAEGRPSSILGVYLFYSANGLDFAHTRKGEGFDTGAVGAASQPLRNLL